MGRRTVAGHKMQFHKQRKCDQIASPADLAGENLANMFEQWARKRHAEGEILSNGQSYLKVERVVRYSDCIVLVETVSGKAGEEGEVFDSSSGEAKYSLSTTDVPTSSARALLICPARGQIALWFSEYSARSSGASLLLTLFHRCWPSFQTGFTFQKNRLIASEVALDSGLVTEVEVRVSRKHDDRSGNCESVEGTVSHKFKPSKKKLLPGSLVDSMRRNPKEAYGLVELGYEPGPEDDAKIFVSVDVEGRKRKVELFNPDDGMYFREELNAPEAPVLSDDEFVAFCTEEAKVFLERSGMDWVEEWSKRK